MTFEYGKEGDILTLVEEGMDVYDAEGNEIGDVDDVFFGTGRSETTVDGAARATGQPLEDDTLVGAFLDVFDDDELPEVLQEKLLAHGFIRLEGGLFGEDRYILREQVGRVTEDGVYLKPYEEEELIED